MSGWEGVFDTLIDVIDGLASGSARAHGFHVLLPFDRNASKPRTHRLEYIFPVEESTKLFKAGNIPGNKLTVNHLVLGTLCLPLYDRSPSPASDDIIFLHFGITNARPRLEERYRDPLAYPAYCLGVSSLHIPVATFLEYHLTERRRLLVDFANAVKKEYQKQAAYPALLAIQPQLWEIMMNGPPAPPWVGPLYAGDGVGSTYLFPTYTSEDAAIEVDHFFVRLNCCDPGPFFRCTEWKGRMILSMDFNEFAVEPSVAQTWMDTWVELLRTLII